MERRFYTLMFAFTPLLFVACTTPQASSSATNIQKATNEVVSQAQTITTNSSVTNVSNGVKYIDKPIVIERGMAHIKGFLGTLKPTLKAALQQDKTQQIAMGACSSVAMQMTNEYNNIAQNAKVRRTSLKYRNPANKPDATDTEVMYRLQAVNDGKPVAVDMGNKYRVYKPLKIVSNCLLCHGDTNRMSKQVIDMLHTKYPHDLATGYKLGEFRGAVVAEIDK